MKLIDKNGRIFEKISIIDIIIVIAVAFLAFSFIFTKTTNNAGGVSVSKKEVQYTAQIKVYGICKTERAPFTVGDNIYGNDGELLGKIENIEVKQTVVKVKLNDGTYINRDSDEFFEYFLTVKGSGNETEKGIFASGTLAVIPSNTITVSSKFYAGSAIVLSVEKTV